MWRATEDERKEGRDRLNMTSPTAIQFLNSSITTLWLAVAPSFQLGYTNGLLGKEQTRITQSVTEVLQTIEWRANVPLLGDARRWCEQQPHSDQWKRGLVSALFDPVWYTVNTDRASKGPVKQGH